MHNLEFVQTFQQVKKGGGQILLADAALEGYVRAFEIVLLAN